MYLCDMNDKEKDIEKQIEDLHRIAVEHGFKNYYEYEVACHKEEERKNVALLDNYHKLLREDSQLHRTAKILCKIGHRYKDIIEEKSYNSILSILDKISLPEGVSLGVKDGDMRKNTNHIPSIVNGMHVSLYQSWEDTCKLFLSLPDGRVEDNIFSKLIVENSLVGAWQALLLRHTHYLVPRFSSGFEYGSFVLNINDVISLKEEYPQLYDQPLKRNNSSFMKSLRNLKERYFNRAKLPDCSIKAVSNKDHNFISFCLFLSEYGLSRRTYDIIIQDSKVQSLSLIKEELIQSHSTVLQF